jgi:hypothetical protein
MIFRLTQEKDEVVAVKEGVLTYLTWKLNKSDALRNGTPYRVPFRNLGYGLMHTGTHDLTRTRQHDLANMVVLIGQRKSTKALRK